MHFLASPSGAQRVAFIVALLRHAVVDKQCSKIQIYSAPRNHGHAFSEIVQGWPLSGRTDMGSGGDCSTSGRSYYSVLGVHLLVSLTNTHWRELGIETQHMSCTRARP